MRKPLNHTVMIFTEHPAAHPQSSRLGTKIGGRCYRRFVPILLQKSFCTRDQNFFWLYTRFSYKDVGTSLREDKLAGDLGNVIEATSIRGRRSDFFTAGKLAPGHLGLLQQYLPTTDSCTAANRISIRSPRRRWGAQPAAPRCSALAPSASL